MDVCIAGVSKFYDIVWLSGQSHLNLIICELELSNEAPPRKSTVHIVSVILYFIIF